MAMMYPITAHKVSHQHSGKKHIHDVENVNPPLKNNEDILK
jgi:hypothetical protein